MLRAIHGPIGISATSAQNAVVAAASMTGGRVRHIHHRSATAGVATARPAIESLTVSAAALRNTSRSSRARDGVLLASSSTSSPASTSPYRNTAVSGMGLVRYSEKMMSSSGTSASA